MMRKAIPNQQTRTHTRITHGHTNRTPSSIKIGEETEQHVQKNVTWMPI